LLQEVHQKIYNEVAEYRLIALPRLEVQGIEDLKTLHEIGVLQPDHAVRLSEVLLGATAAHADPKAFVAAFEAKYGIDLAAAAAARAAGVGLESPVPA
jgi:rhamnose utilization protein RhaD (predicted bifunctional aldolase and dehydrogenase)